MSTTDALTRVGLPGKLEAGPDWKMLNLRVSPALDEVLEELAREGHVEVYDILARAVGLYSYFAQAAKEGKHIGYSSEPGKLDMEVTGF